MRKTVKLSSISNVGTSLTATINCPVGLTYDRITLAYSGTAVTRAMMSNIQVKIGGKPVMTFADADELQEINDYYGRADNAGFVTLYFARPELDNVAQQRLTALGTQDVQTLSIEIDITAAAPGDFALAATAVQSEPQPLGLINKVRAFPMSSSVSGEIEIDNITVGPRIQAIHLFKSDISNLAIDMDSVRVYEATKSLGEVIQKEHGRVPVTASCTHFDSQLENDNAQAMVTRGVQDFRIKPTLDTSGAVRVVVEYLDGLSGI